MSYCDDGVASFMDPKNPPLSEGVCLCRDCCLGHIEECIEEYEGDIELMQKMKEEVTDESR